MTLVGSGEPPPTSILLVDDEPKNLAALDAVLSQPDRILVFARSGEEALKHLLREEFAVVLLDVHMPGLDGFETAALIRGRERSRNTPIIFLTAADRGEAFIQRGYSLGAVDYIVKPFDPDILRSKVAVFVDLHRKTEQVKQQAIQLRETTTFLDSVLQAVTDYAITPLHADGRLQAWTEGARRIFQYANKEGVPGQRLDALLPQQDQQEHVDALLQRAHHEGKAEAIRDAVRQNGTHFPASVVIEPRRDADGHMVGFVAIVQDISDRLRVEAERARLIEEQAARAEAETARRRFAFLAEASSVLSSSLDSAITLKGLAHLVVAEEADACIVDLVDAQGDLRRVVIAFANAAEEAAAGELCSHPNPPGSAELVLQAVKGGCALLRPVWKSLADVAPDAETRKLLARLDAASLMVVPLMARDRALGALTLVGSASRPAFGESELSLAEDLARRAALAVENARLYGEAQAAIRVRDDFLSSATHDLKTPLTAIKGQAQLIHRRIGRTDTPEAARVIEMVGRIESATTKMVGLIDQLLDVAQLQAGRPLALMRRPTDLVAICREAIDDVVTTRGYRDLHLESTVETLVGHWDAARLERVVGNLLGNAVKYSPEGGQITVRVSPSHEAGSDWAELSVVDQGVGIPEADLPNVFERFYRARNVAGKVSGTGIGLAGVRQIVEEHGGSVAVTSTEGQGTTAIIRLPLAAAV